MSKVGLIALVGLGFAVASQAVAASPAPRAQQGERVPMAGVDFRDPAAVKSFYAQLNWAAQRACSSGYQGQAYASRAERACVAETVTSLVNEANRPMLTAAHSRVGHATRLASGY